MPTQAFRVMTSLSASIPGLVHHLLDAWCLHVADVAHGCRSEDRMPEHGGQDAGKGHGDFDLRHGPEDATFHAGLQGELLLLTKPALLSSLALWHVRLPHRKVPAVNTTCRQKVQL